MTCKIVYIYYLALDIKKVADPQFKTLKLALNIGYWVQPERTINKLLTYR